MKLIVIDRREKKVYHNNIHFTDIQKELESTGDMMELQTFRVINTEDPQYREETVLIDWEN